MATAASAQTYGPVLTVDRDYFRLNGAPKFLVFVSFFDGLREAGLTRLDSDLFYLKNTSQVDGVRIWVNICDAICGSTPDTLFDSDTSHPYLRPGTLSALVSFLTKASQYGLIVDVTFTKETIPGPALTTARYTSSIVATAQAIASFRNVLFDLQNEFGCHGDGLSVTDLQQIRDAVWTSADAGRVITASPCSFTAQQTGQFAGGEATYAGGGAFSAAAYHDPRQSGADSAKTWYTQPTLTAVVGNIAAGASPVLLPTYLQEPTAWGDNTQSNFYNSSTDDAISAHFSAAVQNAKIAGAAAWTFHQRAGFDLSTQSFYANLTQNVFQASPGPLATMNALAGAANLAKWGAHLQFIDDPLVQGVTTVKAVHIIELRARIDSLRRRFGLAAYAWTTPTPAAASSIVAAVDIQDMRVALTAAYVAAGQSTPGYSEAITAQVTPVRAQHIAELRHFVEWLEQL